MTKVYRDGEVYYGTVSMPHYHGVEGSVLELDADWSVIVTLDDCRTIEVYVKKGFRFDGCSVPRFLWRVTDHPLVAPRIAAALAHDWIYAAQVVDRKTADLVYRQVLKMVDYSSFKTSVEYRTLRLAGWAAWGEKTDDDRSFAAEHGALWLNGKRKE